MEKKPEAALHRLMDFGRFTGNVRLARLAAEAEARYPASGGEELGDDELEKLFAAGESALWDHPEEENDDR